MGQSKRRRKCLGALYGTPQGSNKPKPCESVRVYKSAWTNKWAVGIDIPGEELRCLDVFLDQEMAERDAMAAREVFQCYTWQDVKNEKKWFAILQEYIQLSTLRGIVSDDECLAVVASAVNLTPNQVNAQLREMGLLSDGIWRRSAIK